MFGRGGGGRAFHHWLQANWVLMFVSLLFILLNAHMAQTVLQCRLASSCHIVELHNNYNTEHITGIYNRIWYVIPWEYHSMLLVFHSRGSYHKDTKS